MSPAQVRGFLLIELRQTASRPAINTIFLPFPPTILLIYDQFTKMKYVLSDSLIKFKIIIQHHH